MTEPSIVRRYRVYGRVQGVGFRHFVWRGALEMGVQGWVRNRRDGTVECLVRGAAAEHERCLSHLEAGPSWARVERVVCVEEPEPEDIAGGFEIRGTV